MKMCNLELYKVIMILLRGRDHPGNALMWGAAHMYLGTRSLKQAFLAEEWVPGVWYKVLQRYFEGG